MQILGFQGCSVRENLRMFRSCLHCGIRLSLDSLCGRWQHKEPSCEDLLNGYYSGTLPYEFIIVQAYQYMSKKILRFMIHDTSIDLCCDQNNLSAGSIFTSNMSHSKEVVEEKWPVSTNPEAAHDLLAGMFLTF